MRCDKGAFEVGSTRKAMGIAAIVAATGATASAAPYASNVLIDGSNNVSFILNEPADSLAVSVNGGAAIFLDPSTSGLKSFSIASATDTFTITAKKLDTGYRIPTGSSTNSSSAGMSKASPFGATKQISSDSNILNTYNSPRGVTVSLNPNAANFGTAYIANTAAGTAGATVRSLGDGLYAVRADQSDAFGYGNTEKTGGLSVAGSSNSPWRLTAGSDGYVYVSDFSDANGKVGRLTSNMSSGELVLAAVGGPTALPAGQNHGSTHAVYPVISGSGMTLYTVDEDLTTLQVTGAGSSTDKNSLWRYSIGTGTLPYSGMPTKVATALLTGATADMDIGKDGKFYLAQNRSAGNEAGLIVLDPSGATLFNSRDASIALFGGTVDLLTNVQGMAVSPDQLYVALILNNNDVAVIPLVNGIPDLAQRLVLDAGSNTASGRDISFDAADNIHLVTSGQALYKVYSPGGDMTSVLSYDGSKPAGQQYEFTMAVPEPGSLALGGLGAIGMLRRRPGRRAGH